MKAESEFRRATELNPSYSVAHQWYANHLVAMGRFDEAAREMSRAREVNPLSLIANGALGWVYFYAGRYEDAVQQCDLALEMNPNWDLGNLWRGQAYEELGRTEDAIASLRRAVELSGRSGISVAARPEPHQARPDRPALTGVAPRRPDRLQLAVPARALPRVLRSEAPVRLADLRARQGPIDEAAMLIADLDERIAPALPLAAERALRQPN